MPDTRTLLDDQRTSRTAAISRAGPPLPEARLICAHLRRRRLGMDHHALRHATNVFLLDTSGSVTDDGVVEMASANWARTGSSSAAICR